MIDWKVDTHRALVKQSANWSVVGIQINFNFPAATCCRIQLTQQVLHNAVLAWILAIRDTCLVIFEYDQQFHIAELFFQTNCHDLLMSLPPGNVLAITGSSSSMILISQHASLAASLAQCTPATSDSQADKLTPAKFAFKDIGPPARKQIYPLMVLLLSS